MLTYAVRSAVLYAVGNVVRIDGEQSCPLDCRHLKGVGSDLLEDDQAVDESKALSQFRECSSLLESITYNNLIVPRLVIPTTSA